MRSWLGVCGERLVKMGEGEETHGVHAGGWRLGEEINLGFPLFFPPLQTSPSPLCKSPPSRIFFFYLYLYVKCCLVVKNGPSTLFFSFFFVNFEFLNFFLHFLKTNNININSMRKINYFKNDA